MLRRRFLLNTINFYWWIFGTGKIWSRHNAKPIHAPAETTETDSEIYTGSDTPLVAKEAAEIEASRGVKFSLLAAVQAYLRVDPIYTAKLFFSTYTNLQKATGAVAKAVKRLSIPFTAKGVKADGVTVESLEKTFIVNVAAVGGIGSTEAVKTAQEFTAESESLAIWADVAKVDVNGYSTTATNAKMATWIDSYIDDEGYLVILQAYSAAITDGYLEVT